MCSTAYVYRDPWIIPVRGSDLAGPYGRSYVETIHALKGYLICAFSTLNLMSQMIKNPPAMQETQVLSLDPEEPWEKGMASYSSILAWRIPWMEQTGGLQSTGYPKCRRHGWENPLEKERAALQYFCLENSMDTGAWWATVQGVAKSQTWLSNYHFDINNIHWKKIFYYYCLSFFFNFIFFNFIFKLYIIVLVL